MLTALIALLVMGSKTSVAKNIVFTFPQFAEASYKYSNFSFDIFMFKAKPKKNFYQSKFIVTAYSADPSENGGSNKTRLGKKVRPGIVSVDPRIIPMGSKIVIPGYGIGIAGDTGGAIRGKRLDLCLASRHQEGRWGRRRLLVTIYPSKEKLWKSRSHP